MLPTTKSQPKRSLSELSVLLYGPSKIGKSTWCSHADKALFLATEPGLNALEVYQTPISQWEQLLSACGEIERGQHDFKLIVIDTADNAYKLCAEHICKKFQIEHESDFGYGKGYALINNEFQRVLNKLAILPYGLILVSHSQENEVTTRTGKFNRIVPTLPEKARKIITSMVDLILLCDFEKQTDAQEIVTWRRVMRTKPNANYDAGDRTGRLPETLPLDFNAFLKAFSSSESTKNIPVINQIKEEASGKQTTTSKGER